MIMASDPISNYQQALQSFEAAQRRVQSLVQIIDQAALHLRNWQRVIVSNSRHSFPTGIGTTSNASINAQTWPTGDQIGEALSQYHSLLHEAGNAYRQIPESQKAVVQPPPDR